MSPPQQSPNLSFPKNLSNTDHKEEPKLNDTLFLLSLKRKETTFNELSYQYFYSENYQSMERLMNNLGKQIQLADDDFQKDF